MKPHNFTRTTCACENCVRCCKRQPGALAAGDYERIRLYLQATDNELQSKLCASPGSIIKRLDTGRTERVGSITPRMHKGRCVFLDERDRCSIHAVAPFGCSMFDTHMNHATAHPRSVWMARSNMDAAYQQLRNVLPYARSYKPSVF
jgi:Fe-S-cluster containining protein